MSEKILKTLPAPFKTTLKRFCVVVIFSIAFAYIEAAVVVYLRAIFHPNGFTFPLMVFGTNPHEKQFLLTEIGREAATLVLILTGAWLAGQNLQQRFAYFMATFTIWDVFFYIWLKVLINWPSSIMDWDILFLIPVTWASPLIAPVLVSIILLIFAIIILYRNSCDRAIRVNPMEWLGFLASGLIVVVSFCIAGLHITEQDFQSYFHWPIFTVGNTLAIAIFSKCLLKKV